MNHPVMLFVFALSAVASLAQEPALPALQRQLADTKVEVRRAAAAAIGKLGGDALPVANALALALADKDAGVAEAAGSALGAIGKKALPTVRKAFGERDRQLAAMSAVERLGADGAELVPDMLKALRKESLELRQAATKASRAVGATAVPHLVAALEERGISYQAVLILGDMGPVAKGAVTDLIAVAENRTEMSIVRGTAASALGSIGAAAVPYVPRLLAIARVDKDSSVRINALGAVAVLGVQVAADKGAVTRLVADSNPEVAAAARRIVLK